MKRKINIGIIAILIGIFSLLSGCSCLGTRNMNYVTSHEPHFVGKVEQVMNDYVVVSVNKAEAIYKEKPIIHVSLDVELLDSYLDLKTGDEIVIYYDGNITNDEPAKAEKIYAITLRTPAERESK